MDEISEKQLESNRENAKLGGVKTEEGKAISRYNAINETVLVEIGKKLRSELQPQSELELVLVDRITANVWRLKRVMQIEREMIEADKNDTYNSKKSIGKGFTSYNTVHYDTYGKLIRYETSIERGIYKALHELQRLQADRNGEKVPLPVAIDLDISKEE